MNRICYIATTPDDKELIICFGYSLKELAERLRIPLNTLYTRLWLDKHRTYADRKPCRAAKVHVYKVEFDDEDDPVQYKLTPDAQGIEYKSTSIRRVHNGTTTAQLH